MAFPGGGATDASPLGAASPLGTPSAGSARNVIALARHALADRACRLIASRRTRFRQRLQGSAETAAARGGYCRTRQAGAGSATAWPDARGRRDPGAGNDRARTGPMCARDGLRSGGAGTGRRDQHRDGRSGTAADNSGNAPLRHSRKVTGVQGRCALPRRRACGGRPCSSPRWSSRPRCGGRCRRRG